MTVIKIAGTVVRGSTHLAATAVRHPIGTAAGAVGLARGAARGAVGLGLELLQGTQEPSVRSTVVPEPTPEPATESPVDKADEGRDALPGPDLFAPPPVDPADLPEPVVIHADDDQGEEFHTEPKASSRASGHGGPAGDREEAEGYVEEIPAPEEQPGLQG